MPVNNEAAEAESSSASLAEDSSSSAPPPKLPPSTTQSEEDTRQSVEEDKRHKAQEEAHLQAQQEKARHEAEGSARKQAEEMAHLQAKGEVARQAHEREQQQHAEEQARLQAEQETLRLADQEREQTRAAMEAHWKAEQQQEQRAESTGQVLEGGVSDKKQSVEEEDRNSAGGVSEIVSKYIQNASPHPSPVNRQAELASLATVGNIRARFEESSSKDNGKHLLFGEAFRQKLRLHELSDREQKEAAQRYLRGYNDLRGAYGEVDNSNLEKTYSFQNEEEYGIPNDGICKVDYQTQKYQGLVFVVHETRGMLLLNQHSASLDKNTDSQEPSEKINIPGGSLIEKEYLAAAQQSGHSKMQLQLAARQGAARHLFQTTGIDMRGHLQRLTPAIIHSNPPVDEKGLKFLKNEHENKLFFFLQVSDADLIAISSEPQTDNTASHEEADDDDEPGKTWVGPSGEMDSPWKLKLCAGVSNFTFVQDPVAASSELGEKGADASVSTALDMLMHLAVGPSNNGASTATTYRKGEHGHTGGSQVLQSKETTQWSGSMTVVEARENVPETSRKESEINSKQKTPQEPNVAQEVACCCGFW